MTTDATSGGAQPQPREGFDLDGYLARIGHEGDRRPTLGLLRELHLKHPARISFENLDPFLARPVELDAATLDRKLVRNPRGGYCFEQNLLFLDALRALGFQASGLAARVMWNRPPGTLTPRGHMLLRIEIAGTTYIADVGFGGLTQTAPLELREGEQATPHEMFRLMREGDHFLNQAFAGGEWRTLYRFDLAENFDVDYAVTSYFLSTHPQSQFVTGLMLARPLADRRHALANNRLTTHYLDGRSERETFESAGDLADAIETRFDLAIPDRDAFARHVRDKGILG